MIVERHVGDRALLDERAIRSVAQVSAGRHQRKYFQNLAARDTGIVSRVKHSVRRQRQFAVLLGAQEIVQESARLDVDLIEVQGPEQLGSVIAHVPSFHHPALDFALHADIPLLYVRRSKIRVGDSKIRGRAEVVVVLERARDDERWTGNGRKPRGDPAGQRRRIGHRLR